MTAFDDEWTKLAAKITAVGVEDLGALRRIFYLGAHSLMRAMAAAPESEHMRLMRGIQERLMDDAFEIVRTRREADPHLGPDPDASDPHQPGMHGEGTFP